MKNLRLKAPRAISFSLEITPGKLQASKAMSFSSKIFTVRLPLFLFGKAKPAAEPMNSLAKSPVSAPRLTLFSQSNPNLISTETKTARSGGTISIRSKSGSTMNSQSVQKMPGKQPNSSARKKWPSAYCRIRPASSTNVSLMKQAACSSWGLAFRKRFCRGFDFELQASATDNGILLSVGPNQSFPLDAMFKMLNPANCRSILVQALLDVPMFEIRWRWNATRALAVLRTKGGKRVPPHLQRYRSNDLLTAVFPLQTQCFEHRTGDLEVPDHPLVKQTVVDCLQEAMDANRFEGVMQRIAAGEIELIARDTREPSPFCYELIHANPYAFLDDAPLEERRVRALSTRFQLDPQAFQNLSGLAPEAVSQIVA
ncbi:MAG: hypothetical protein EOP07_11455, partial [Proteobacteria bacterium]